MYPHGKKAHERGNPLVQFPCWDGSRAEGLSNVNRCEFGRELVQFKHLILWDESLAAVLSVSHSKCESEYERLAQFP